MFFFPNFVKKLYEVSFYKLLRIKISLLHDKFKIENHAYTSAGKRGICCKLELKRQIYSLYTTSCFSIFIYVAFGN